MASAATIRHQIESALANRIPSALSPAPRIIREVAPTGVGQIDAILGGGLPLGAITEMVGPECSGRTSLALSFVASMTRESKVCAWIDVSDALHPESAAAAGVDLSRLLWVRCGVVDGRTPLAEHNSFALKQEFFTPPEPRKGLHGGGVGSHPRSAMKGISAAIPGLLQGQATKPPVAATSRLKSPGPHDRKPEQQSFWQQSKPRAPHKPWSRIDQALRATDLLLQGGGFSCIVLDMAGIAPEFASRVPLATWFRYRAAAGQSQASILLLVQYPCAKSSAGLALHLGSGQPLLDEPTVFTGMHQRVQVSRERFTPTSGNVVSMRKPPARETGAEWKTHATWERHA